MVTTYSRPVECHMVHSTDFLLVSSTKKIIRRFAQHIVDAAKEFVRVGARFQNSYQRAPNSSVGERRRQNRLRARQRHFVGVESQRRHAFDEAVATGKPRQDSAAGGVDSFFFPFEKKQAQRAGVAVDVVEGHLSQNRCCVVVGCLHVLRLTLLFRILAVLRLCRDSDALEHCALTGSRAAHPARQHDHLDGSMLLDDLSHGQHEIGGVLWVPS